MTRMWMVDPTKLCKNHLLGEHKEIHQLLGSVRKDHSLDGFVRNKLIQPGSVVKRHSELVVEMKRRGYNHHSDILDSDVSLINNYPEYTKLAKVSIVENEVELKNRCLLCKFGIDVNNVFKKEE